MKTAPIPEGKDAAQICELGGPPGRPRSHMWPRRLVEAGELPPPKKLNGRNYWRYGEVLEALGLADRQQGVQI